MAGITKWGLCPAPGRPGRIASQEVDSAYCGSRCQQLTVSEHLAVACSLTCTRYKAALRRRFAQAHGTSSGSGPRRLGTEAQMRFFRPETRGHPQGLGAPSDHRWRGAVSGGAERSQAEGGDQRPGLSIRQAAPAAAAFMLHSYAPRQSGSGSKSLTGRLAVHCQASKSLTGSIAESPCRPGQGAIKHSSGLRHARALRKVAPAAWPVSCSGSSLLPRARATAQDSPLAAVATARCRTVTARLQAAAESLHSGTQACRIGTACAGIRVRAAGCAEGRSQPEPRSHTSLAAAGRGSASTYRQHCGPPATAREAAGARLPSQSPLPVLNCRGCSALELVTQASLSHSRGRPGGPPEPPGLTYLQSPRSGPQPLAGRSESLAITVASTGDPPAARYGPSGSGRSRTRIVGCSPDKPMLWIVAREANGYKAEGFSRERVFIQ